MKRLYYIRHGLSLANQNSYWSGRSDVPLVQEGIDQAKQAGEAAKAHPIDLIVASPMLRTRETARHVAEAIGYPFDDIQFLDLLKERDFGPLEGTLWTKTSAAMLNDGSTLPEGVETVAEVLARAQKAYEHLQSLPAENILVVGHGSVGRALRHHAVPGADFHERIPNATLVRWI